MTPALNTDHVAAAAEIDNVDHLLGDLELGATVETEVIEHIGELDAASESAVEGAIAKAEVYEELPGGGTAIIAPAKETKEKKVRAAKTPKEPKVKIVRELSALPAETFLMHAFFSPSDAYKAEVIGLRPAQKKIGEKFDNLFLSIAANRKPSTYTMACFNVLAEKGTVTSMDLVGALKASTVSTGKTKGTGYNEGTARSQAGQLMALFDIVGIATRDKQTLTLISDSPIAAKLKALA